ncbi:TPA: hypothetical protein L9V35_001645 [Klebsiella pneumoniae]|uniref:hypothetical protein n=1 Tax=Klebsiella pneumoniae TaxID=573 RepID=UPI000D1A27F1|nr:hypothetical protein [Klebsiella pneumoniae]AWA73326.1 hypothetical protein C6M02_10860 [Klebsiella pneumoniae]MBU3237082.1 hypothetical protein [Klebsiella pneumoniae]MBU3242727.1 hypothetical protein [Klebsiella pneumoniae]MBU3248165.1 hypothetical protein [Klebsiella pneumoniae]MCB3237907.1 hypothetical protein [Klebsiella pneumoniae]
MKERGMIFNGEMVRAILDGRKTQTRRIMAPQPEPCPRGGHWWPSNVFKTMLHVEDEMQNGKGGWGGLVGDACPFGDVGDRIWVREAFASGLSTKSTLAYRATHKREDLEDGFYDTIKWTPSIHMPRWASRILLEITGVRVERLNAISEEDARAEGIIDGGCLNCGEPEPCGCANPEPDATDAFAYLWQSIYGQESWNADPWVWVIEFKRVEGGAA